MKSASALFLLIVANFVVASPQTSGNATTLDEILREVLANNPKIKAVERRWQAALNLSKVNSSPEDPTFRYARFGENVETRVGPQEEIYSVSQKLFFPGKLNLKRRIGLQDAEVASLELAAKKRDLVFEAKSAYYELAWIDECLTVLGHALTALNNFARVAEQEYATGQGIQVNVLKAQLESTRILERKVQFQKLRHHRVTHLNVLQGKPRPEPIPTLAKLDSARKLLDKKQLLEKAFAERQDLLSISVMSYKSENMRALAKKAYWPDLTLMLNYINIGEDISLPRSGKDAWSVSAEINIPIWYGKRRAAVRQAEALLAANNHSREDLKNKTHAEIDHLFVDLGIIDEALNLYEQGLILQASTARESALASYRTGRLDFLELLDSELIVLNLKLAYAKEKATYHKQLAALEQAVGGNLVLQDR